MLSVEVVNSGAIPPSHNIKPSHKFTTKPVQTIIVALFCQIFQRLNLYIEMLLGMAKHLLQLLKRKSEDVEA